jgi:hypothetical protein
MPVPTPPPAAVCVGVLEGRTGSGSRFISSPVLVPPVAATGGGARRSVDNPAKGSLAAGPLTPPGPPLPPPAAATAPRPPLSAGCSSSVSSPTGQSGQPVSAPRCCCCCWSGPHRPPLLPLLMARGEGLPPGPPCRTKLPVEGQARMLLPPLPLPLPLPLGSSPPPAEPPPPAPPPAAAAAARGAMYRPSPPPSLRERLRACLCAVST